MIDKIKNYIAEVEQFNASTQEEIENFRIKFLGKKGILNEFFAEFKNVPNESKKRVWANHQSTEKCSSR